MQLSRKVKTDTPGQLELIKKDFRKNKYVLYMAIPVFLWYLIFCYIPMTGIVTAFFNYNIAKGLLHSKFVGFKYFKEFLTGFYAFRTIKNTLAISLLTLAFGFPAPVIIALLLNEVNCKPFKQTVQTITYLPHFISIVVVCGMLVNFSAKSGVFNDIAEFFGHERVSYLLEPKYFRTIYVASGVWQSAGWGSIIYLAALSGIDVGLYEAAKIDGAGRLRQLWNITLPGIAPTIIVMLILNMGRLMSEGSEKVILLYNENTYETADIISSFVYRRGIVEANYSYSTAVGLFNAVINLILLTITNMLSRKLTETSLW